MKQKGILSAFTLKMIMAVLMLLDHLHAFLPGMPLWFTCLGRLVAPTFCFLMTESLFYTRNRDRYIRRMLTAGLIMLAGSTVLMAIFREGLYNTIFLSLGLSALIVDSLERLIKEGLRLRTFVRLVAGWVLCLFVEGTYLIPVMAVIFYFLRDRKALMSVAYTLGGWLVVYLQMGLYSANPANNIVLPGGFSFYVQYLQVFALIPVLLYSGKPGVRNTFSKWFFYLFYPLHIWILYLISVLLY